MHDNFGSSSFGLEEVANEFLVILEKYLPADIDVINAKCFRDDEKLSERLGRTIEPVLLEPVNSIDVGEPKPLTDQFYDFENTFPRVNIIASQARDTGEGGDSYKIYSIPVSVECWIKASPQEGSSVAFKRASRIIDAVNLSMSRAKGLNGLVMDLNQNPQSAISPVITKDLNTPGNNQDNTFFVDQEDHFNGWYLCGGGIIYNILKNSSI